MTDISPEEKASLLGELVYDHMLCPNVTNILVRGSLLSKTRFALQVTALQGAYDSGIINKSIAFS